MAAKKESAKVKQARREYNAIKSVYHGLGKKVLGKPARSPIRKDYAIAKSAYHQAGRHLAKLTKRKPRKSR